MSERRLKGWESAYLETLARYMAQGFEWGDRDCFLLPLDVADAVTGTAYAAEARGTYTTRLGAYKALADRGWKNVGDAFASRFPETVPAMARRADVGTIQVGDLCCGVVVIGEDVFGMDESAGVVRVPRAHLTRVFKIG